MKKVAKRPRIRLAAFEAPFTSFAIHIHAVRLAAGDLDCRPDNETWVTDSFWMTDMAANRASAASALWAPSSPGRAMRCSMPVSFPAPAVMSASPGTETPALRQTQMAALGRRGLTGAFQRSPQPGFRYVSTCLLKRQGLDEGNLRVPLNAIDYCLNLRAAGHRAVSTPAALLNHHESKSCGAEKTAEKRERFHRDVRFRLEKRVYRKGGPPSCNPNPVLDGETGSPAFRQRPAAARSLTERALFVIPDAQEGAPASGEDGDQKRSSGKASTERRILSTGRIAIRL